MSIFPFLHFFATIVYWYLSVYIIVKNPKAMINYAIGLFNFSLGVWSFSMIFIHNPHVTKETAMFFTDIGVLGWGTFSGFFLWFILLFTRQKALLRKKWMIALLIGIPMVNIALQYSIPVYGNLSSEYFGWKSHLSVSSGVIIFLLGYICLLTVGLYLIINFTRKTTNITLKKQSAIITLSIVISLILGSMIDVIFPIFGLSFIPNIGNISSLIWAFGVSYAMTKYKFLTITPATAADNIISTMSDSLILLDMRGEIVSVNKATEDLSGYLENELKGASMSMLLALAELNEGLDKVILNEGEIKYKDIVFKTKEGGEIPVEFSSSQLRDEAGNVGGIVCIAKDISGRKRLEDEIYKSKKLESIGIFAAGIAHDFNNLLGAIIGNISMAQNDMPPIGQAHKYLSKAEAISLKAAELIKRFITFSPGAWVQREKIIFSNLLEELKKSGLPGKNEKISYDFDIPRHLLPIDGDPGQLSQVIYSLFQNAVEAMPFGGNILVCSKNMILEKSNKYLLKEGGFVKVSIEDNGPGIPRDIIEKVFDPYFSTKGKVNESGAGLGLTSCYSIIKKHDGHIDIESPVEMNKGTRVSLYLPVKDNLSKG